MIVADSFGHLYTTDSITELHEFAVVTLGLNPKWNHCSRWFPHWDLTTNAMKNRAWKAGAHHPESHKENAQLISEAEAYAKTLPLTTDGVLYRGKGLFGQDLLRVNYDVLFKLMKESP